VNNQIVNGFYQEGECLDVGCHSRAPDRDSAHPPSILVHGAAHSASIWTFWQNELAAQGWASYAIDLCGHGRSLHADLSSTSMQDSAADGCMLAQQFKRPPIILGWSMGGLVALMIASAGVAAACIALAPSTPARQRDLSVALRRGEFGPEEYGITSRDPQEQIAMPDLNCEERLIALASLSRESRLAKDKCTAGIVIASLPCPLLLVTGTEDKAWPAERYHDLRLKLDHFSVESASHWRLVLNRQALGTMISAVLNWLENIIQQKTFLREG
jgi:pimeloyl-ACP methyl ester carboxylesterase